MKIKNNHLLSTNYWQIKYYFEHLLKKCNIMIISNICKNTQQVTE